MADASASSRLSDLKQKIFDMFGNNIHKDSRNTAAVTSMETGAGKEADDALNTTGGYDGGKYADKDNSDDSSTKDFVKPGDQDDSSKEADALVVPPPRFMRLRNSGPKARLATAPEPQTTAGGARKKRRERIVGVGKRIFRDDLDLRSNAKPLLDGTKVRYWSERSYILTN